MSKPGIDVQTLRFLMWRRDRALMRWDELFDQLDYDVVSARQVHFRKLELGNACWALVNAYVPGDPEYTLWTQEAQSYSLQGTASWLVGEVRVRDRVAWLQKYAPAYVDEVIEQEKRGKA